MQRFVEAYNRHDVEAMLENLEPEVEWHSDILAALGGEARVYRGREGFRDGLRDLFEALGETHIEFPEIRDLGDRVIAIGRIRARGKGSGAETESLHATVVDLKDGKAVRIWAYLDPQEALEAAGLWSRAMSQQGLEIVRRSATTTSIRPGARFQPSRPGCGLGYLQCRVRSRPLQRPRWVS